MKSIYIVMSSLLFLLTPLNLVASDVKDQKEGMLPTIEEIMNDYEVNEEEAHKILTRFENEEKQFEKEQREITVFSNLSEEEIRKNQMIEAMIQEESQEITAVYGSGGMYGVVTPYIRQTTLYNCGPAAVQMALGARGVNRSQGSLEYEMWTTAENGTSGKHMRNVLNKYTRGQIGYDWYVWKTMNSWDRTTLENGVRLNIKNKFTPILGIYQATGGSRTLVGHTNTYLRHFVTVTGYTGSNASRIEYNDPVNGWGGRYRNVPRYGSMTSNDLAYLVWGGSLIY